jgi:hypothetical protein
MKSKALFIFFLFSFMFIANETFARFGGSSGGGGDNDYGSYDAGGDYSSGSDWSSGSSGGNYGGGSLPWPLAIILLIVFIVVGIYKIKMKEEEEDNSFYVSLPKVKAGFISVDEKFKILSQLKNFDQNAFLEKVKTCFNKVQYAWGKKDIASIRRFISDGMYQRINTQFLVMDSLGQTNYIEFVNLLNANIAYVEQKNPFDVIYVEFKAFISEQYTHPKFKQLNQVYKENFTEYWVFIRKINSSGKDLYNSTACPSCGNPLDEKMGEVSKCNACGVYTNAGEFDWILSEVIQADEFFAMMDAKKYYNSINSTVNNIQHIFPELTIPVLEDKASNAYLQVKMAMASNESKRIGRFSTDQFAQTLAENKENPFQYNRFFLRKVALVNIFDNQTHYFAAFNVKYTAQRVKADGEKLVMIDYALQAKDDYLVLTIKKDHKLSNHSVLACTCTNCGGALNDTVDLTCPYCNSVLNDDARDWIVLGIYSYDQFNEFKKGFNSSPRVQQTVELKFSSQSLQLRDYALNNIMVILNADGQLTTDEKKFALRVTKLLGYKNEEMAILWEQGATKKMGIQMPADKKKQQKIYKLMQKAAESDKLMTVAEMAILKQISEKYELLE